jgi:ethanolamine ammonia-lyase large subunit
LYVRKLLGLRPAPEFELWLRNMQIVRRDGPDFALQNGMPAAFEKSLQRLR